MKNHFEFNYWSFEGNKAKTDTRNQSIKKKSRESRKKNKTKVQMNTIGGIQFI